MAGFNTHARITEWARESIAQKRRVRIVSLIEPGVSLGGQLWRFRVRIPSLLYYWLTGVGYGGREGINILS